MPTPVQHLVESMFAGVEALDVDAATAQMRDDIVLYDPHYPYPDMAGIAAVREGLAWAFTQMSSMRFDIERWFFDADGTSVVVETSTHHVLKMGGKRLDFPQVFVIDTDGERITKMRAYEPYGPHGMTGFGLKIGHAVYRFSHRRSSGVKQAR
ncbi:nuclear transport factor 2 family protein [Agromyces subbeticus]|uniref:nuclear transport factor 2 family protein n=1 Tax=Agromyces subbeticus TaxID=293890 RepID=UPI0003F6FAB1|nr:nuclear transport factor 2 family protein [Agromyces subbeticus]